MFKAVSAKNKSMSLSLHWLTESYNDINGYYFITIISITGILLFISLFEMCITDISFGKKLWYRFLTFLWCLFSFCMNILQIYSYHDNSLIVMKCLRGLTAFGFVICGLCTYNFVIGTVDSVYLYETKRRRNAPKWFKDCWNILLLFNAVSLFILYGCAFSQNNAIFFDIHWLIVGLTFWTGCISVFIATIKIARFVRQTLRKMKKINKERNGIGIIPTSSISSTDIPIIQSRSLSNDNNDDNDAWNKMTKLRRFRRRLFCIVCCGTGTLICITIYTINMFKHIFIHKYHHSLAEQPYPNLIYYLNASIFLILFDGLLLFWIFTIRCGCKNTANQLFCKLFCCRYCFNLNQDNSKKSSIQRQISQTTDLISKSDISINYHSSQRNAKITDYTI